jgi:hypothetical protein
MRVIEARMIQAIRRGMANASHAGVLLKSGNTEVYQAHHGHHWTPGYYREIQVRLFGNLIGVVEPDTMRIRLSDCGYRTATTKSRLNALLRAFVPGEGIGQRDFAWYAAHGAWEGSDEWQIRLDADNYFLRQAERIAA